MKSLLWAAAGGYAGWVVVVWCCLYGDLRARRSRLHAWAVTSLVALLWLPWLAQYRWWRRRHPVGTWVDQLERELQAIDR